MKFKIPFSTSNRAVLKKWSVRFLVLSSLSAIAVGAVISASALPPEVVLPSEPLFMNGGKTKGNLMLALSVEFPTVGQTYQDNFDETKEYVGYFDPKFCYKSGGGGSPTDGYFDLPRGTKEKATLSAQCSNNRFDGNFMNWATSSAVDVMRYGLTGGNRVVDQPNVTILERAWLPDWFYDGGNFNVKFILASAIAGRTELASTSFPNGMWIYNCKNRVYFANAQDDSYAPGHTCESPFGIPNALSPNLITKGGRPTDGNFYAVKTLVCDAASGPNRLMTYDTTTKKWTGLCYRYPSGELKPVGQLQVNAENLRVGVTGYTQDPSRNRYGGVLRAPLKYLGSKKF